MDGSRIDDLDVVVLATGYQHGDYSWLPPDVEQRLGADEDGLYLYRHVLPPRVPVRFDREIILEFNALLLWHVWGCTTPLTDAEKG